MGALDNQAAGILLLIVELINVNGKSEAQDEAQEPCPRTIAGILEAHRPGPLASFYGSD